MFWIELHLIDDISFTWCRNHFTSTAQTSRGQIWINHFRSVVSAIAERVDNSFHSESWIRWRFKQRSIAVQTGTSHSFLRHCTGPWMLGSSSGRPGTTLARERLHPWNLRHPPGTRVQTFRSLHQILHQSIVSGTNAQRPQVIIPHNKIWTIKDIKSFQFIKGQQAAICWLSASIRVESSLSIVGHAQFLDVANAAHHSIAATRRCHFPSAGKRYSRIWTLPYDSCHPEQGQSMILLMQVADLYDNFPLIWWTDCTRV